MMQISRYWCFPRISPGTCSHEPSHGRLATAVGGSIDIFPVNFGLLERTIYLRTAPGEKLAALTVHESVAFEADGILVG